MSGGGGGSKTVEKQNIPAEFSPLANEYADSVLYRSRMAQPVYTGQRLADPTQWQQQALDMTAQRALNGSPVTQSAQNMATQTLGGSFLGANLGSNQYLGQGAAANSGSQYIPNLIAANQQDTVDAYNRSVRPQLDTAAARAGAFGDNSGYREMQAANNYNLLKTLSNQANDIRFTAGEAQAGREQAQNQFNAGLAESALNRNASLYNSERARQIQSLLFAPQLAQADYTDATMLGQAGDLKRAFSQEQLDQAQKIWAEYAYMPYKNIDMLGNALGVGTGLGGTGSSFSPYSSNPAMGAVGGGLAGAAAGAYTGAQIGSGYPGYGTIIGGILGAGLGYMGSS